MIEVKIDLGERIAYVDRNCDEKYARKLLQDKLKAETPYKGGWYCAITNRSRAPHVADGKPHAFIPHSSKFRDWNEMDDQYYIFELSNPFATMGGLL